MKWTGAAVLAVAVLASAASADDALPPSYRGLNRTVTAQWDTWIGSGPGGIPADTYTENPDMGRWAYVQNNGAQYHPTVAGRTGVMELFAHDNLVFHLDNYPDGAWKKIRVQITLYQFPVPGDAGINVTTDAGTTILVLPESCTWSYHMNNWITYACDYEIAPNPAWEEIGLKFFTTDGAPNYPPWFVDQVTIDTFCPEPATLGLLAVGGLALLARRRR